MSKNTIRGNGEGANAAIREIATRQTKSLNDIRSEQAINKRNFAIQKKAQKELNKLKIKDEQEAAKKYAEFYLKYMKEAMSKEMAERQKAEKENAKKAETEELVARARQRKEEKIARKEAREDQITAAREAALEQIEGATTMGEKMKGIGNLFKSSLMEVGDNLSEAATNAVNNIADALSGTINKYLDTYTKYMSSINARIQGAYAGVDYTDLEEIIRNNTAGSPYIKYEDVLENLNSLVKEGTAVNLTQRAFLATISDKIATTFDALEPSLLRLIRIQQSDTTAARLGMEAELTKLFNYYFSDTSYLSKAFDSVTTALTDLSSQLGATGAVEFDYIVQKWLGSLGSVGVEDNTLTNIAEAINALGTGQIDAINENMQNLLVLAANRVGLDYGEILLDGLTSTKVNDLLYGVIDLVQDTVSEANNVVKAQYAQLFGLSVADINAFSNISDEVISALYESGMTYENTLTSLDQQLNQVGNRMHLSEMIDNVFDNILAATGTSIAGNAGLFGTYKAFDLLENITGGIHIPTITVFGSGITLPDSIEGMVKAGITGIGTAISLISAIGNWADGSGLNRARWIGSWDTSDNAKGSYSGFTSMNELQNNTSSTGIVSNTNESGMQQSVYDEQQKAAEEISGAEQTGEEDSQMVKLLTRLVEYFEKSKSAEYPFYVQLYTPKNSAQDKTTLSLQDMVKIIMERVIGMGTDEYPLYVLDDNFNGVGENKEWYPDSTL